MLGVPVLPDWDKLVLLVRDSLLPLVLLDGYSYVPLFLLSRDSSAILQDGYSLVLFGVPVVFVKLSILYPGFFLKKCCTCCCSLYSGISGNKVYRRLDVSILHVAHMVFSCFFIQA